jgi:non-ribosomal peptide synthetase component F/SAM-dependent methyltransferase
MRLASLSATQRTVLDRLLADRGLAAPALDGITRQADRSSFPLSFAQQRIWFFNRLQPDSTLYNIAGSARLVGRVDVDVLRRSIEEVVRRHEVVRTTYHLEENRPVQRVNAPSPVPLPVVDLGGLPDEERQERLRELYRTEVSRPFDLERDQFLRPMLVRLDADRHVLVLSQHHIATDGWSLGVLLGELSVLYRAFATGWSPPLPELPLQYGDFAAWQRRWLSGSTLERQLDYWRRQLAEAPLLDLPPARARPLTRSWDGDSVPCRLPAPLVQRLRRLGDSERATLYMVLVAAFAVVASRWSGQEDVVVGAPVANRNRPEIENLIGCFVNTLPLRLTVPAGVTFRQLLASVRQVCLDGYANQDVPFDKIVEAVNPERAASAATPLVRHMLGLHNTPQPALELPDLQVELVGLNTGKARFDLELELYSEGEGIGGIVWFAVELFSRGLVTRLVDSLATVLDAAAGDPDTPVARLPLVPAAPAPEAGSAAARTADARAMLDAIEIRAGETPEAVAVQGAGTLTYRELSDRASRLAGYLRDRGAGPEQPVVVCLPPSPARVVAFLAVARLGAVHVAVDPARPDDQIAEVLRGSAAAVVITHSALPAAARAGARACPLDGDAAAIEVHRPAHPRDPIAPAAVALLIWSGGRAVAVTYAGLCGQVRQLAHDCQLAPGATVVVAGAVEGAAWPAEVLWSLAGGARLLLPDAGQAGDAGRLRRLLEEQRATVACLPALTLSELVAGARTSPPPATLAHVFAGGEPRWPALVDRSRRALPEAAVHFRYGPADAPTAITATGAADAVAAVGSRLAILDEYGQLVPEGACGELCLGGDQLPRGFWRRPGETAAAFVPDPVRPGERLLRTGELATFSPEEGLCLLGGVADRMLVGGHLVSTGEVRAVLETHPAVDRAVVRRRPGGDLIAYLSVADHTAGTAGTGDRARWRKHFERAYLERPAQDDAALNPSGWTSPHTGRYLSDAELREWSDATLRRVAELAPRRVIEIGCRTGPLLFRLAPRCESYCGIDPSANALAHIEQHRDRLAGKADSVRLLRRAPDDLAGIADGSVDLVVLSSLAQYFPSVGYLRMAIREALRVVAPGGSVVLTDVRSAPLEHARRLADLHTRLPATAPLAQLQATATQQAQAERELLLDPVLFRLLADQVPGIAEVSVLARAWRHCNELSTLRYDVVLRAGERGSLPEGIDWVDRCPEDCLPETLRARLLAGAGTPVGLRGLADPRVAAEVRLAELVSRRAVSTVGELGEALRAAQAAPGLDPAGLAELAAEHGHGVTVGVGLDGRPGTLDVVFRPLTDGRTSLPAPGPALPTGALGDYANAPELAAAAAEALPRIEAHLRERLADHQRPAHLLVVRRWALGHDDRIDPSVLPAPDAPRASAQREEHEEPRTEMERVIARIWSEVLGLEQVGVRDDFFALGGHSLMGAEVVDRIREICEVDIPLGQMFAAPTIAEVAAFVTEAKASGEPANAPIRRADRSRRRPASAQRGA